MGTYILFCFYESREMPSLPDDVTEELEDIEKIAKTDLKRAYQLCLKAQARYAFTPKECFFEIYAHVIRLLNKKNSIVQTDRAKKATEQDFVNEAWTPIMTTIFNDDELILKWGDSVPQISAVAKKRALPEEDVLGNRIDLRVIGKNNDVLAGEFANSKLGSFKFTSDHLKLLRESKVIFDNIANQRYTSNREVRRLIVPSFQANGLDGEVKIMKLFSPGLYTVQHIGSVDIPTNVNYLRDLRKKIIPRLNYVKYHTLKNANTVSNSLEKEARKKKKKSNSYERSPSYDDAEVETRWTRGTWFPSRKPSAPIIIPSDLL
ncbi:hypothetical protein MFLAVUS_009046 [Mucor flavus]|uniref:Uncharacterized protein n=1 Tax=Mucor flavus TaxID=439312 RepID=A0ABP9Z8Z4_9FUNG